MSEADDLDLIRKYSTARLDLYEAKNLHKPNEEELSCLKLECRKTYEAAKDALSRLVPKKSNNPIDELTDEIVREMEFADKTDMETTQDKLVERAMKVIMGLHEGDIK